MNAPIPAAVRAAMKPPGVSCTDEEEHAFMQEKRYSADILRDHIRAVAAEMRAEADEYTKLAQGSVYELAEFRLRTVKTLGRFADKLEGKL